MSRLGLALAIWFMTGCATDPAELARLKLEGDTLAASTWYRPASTHGNADHRFDADAVLTLSPDGRGKLSSRRFGYVRPGLKLGSSTGFGAYTEVASWPIAWEATGDGEFDMECTGKPTSTGITFVDKVLPLSSAKMSGKKLTLYYDSGEEEEYEAVSPGDPRLHPSPSEIKQRLARWAATGAQMLAGAPAPAGPGRYNPATPAARAPSNGELAALQGPDEKGDGHDIVTLLARKKIEVETQGDDIHNVHVKIKKLVPEPLQVRIPVGTFFVSANSGSQNMVTTSARSITLTDNEWHRTSTDTACANRPRHIPGSGDTFQVLRSPHQAELARLMPVLDAADVDYPTKQAAVWMVTDDADYADLGILQTYSGSGRQRVIGEQETARAMRILEKAGIPVTSKAIWRDRQQILRGLGEGSVKNWLEQKQ